MIIEKFVLCRRMFLIHSSPTNHLMTPLIYLVTLLGGPDPGVGNHWATILLYDAVSRFLFIGPKPGKTEPEQKYTNTFYDRLLIF